MGTISKEPECAFCLKPITDEQREPDVERFPVRFLYRGIDIWLCAKCQIGISDINRE